QSLVRTRDEIAQWLEPSRSVRASQIYPTLFQLVRRPFHSLQTAIFHSPREIPHKHRGIAAAGGKRSPIGCEGNAQDSSAVVSTERSYFQPRINLPDMDFLIPVRACSGQPFAI